MTADRRCSLAVQETPGPCYAGEHTPHPPDPAGLISAKAAKYYCYAQKGL